MIYDEIVKKITQYINSACASEEEIPTLAGLAIALEISKKKLLELENSHSRKVRMALI